MMEQRSAALVLFLSDAQACTHSGTAGPSVRNRQVNPPPLQLNPTSTKTSDNSNNAGWHKRRDCVCVKEEMKSERILPGNR